MASSAKDLQLRELKDAVSQLKTMVSEQTELIKSLRLIIDEKSSHEKVLQEQVDYLTKKLFGSSSERRPDDIPGQQNLFNEAEAEQDPSLLEEETVIVKSQVPQALAGKGPAAASTVAWTMYQKYANGLPLYRQEKDWKQYGAQISRTTLANWIVYCSRNYFQPMYDYFHRELLKRSFAMADETRIQVLKEEDRRAQTQSFMWLFRSGEDGLPPIILYGYSPTRSGNHAREFLNGFHGYLETDGYQGYNGLPDIKRCSCWAHIRRYFIDAVPKGKQYDYSQPAVQGVQYCNRLFAIEDSIHKKYPGDYEKRKQLRLEKEKPVLEAFWSWIDQQKPVRNTRMDKAVNYALNRRETAEIYLEDGRCSFTNNLSENAIRPFAVGRKNWLFSDSVEGANASAVVYTMVEMAKAHDLNIYGYLKFLLDHRPTKEMTDDQLAELAPWSEKLQSIKNRM